jgi:uncharacterized protein YggE
MKTPHFPRRSTDTDAAAPQLRINLNLRWVCWLLLAIILGMLLAWRPWHPTPSSANRTVTGDATVKAAPDQFGFYPSYQFEEADKDTAIKAATAKQNEIVAGLKAAGVSDKQIKTDIHGYGSYPKPLTTELRQPALQQEGYTYTLQVTVSVPTSTLAQKVQDYLATTSPQGNVTSVPIFSESLRNTLESRARDQATRSARSKADQSARNLGFSVGGVKSVDDGSGFDGGIEPMDSEAAGAMKVTEADSGLSLQPGENELSYSVTVVYYIK